MQIFMSYRRSDTSGYANGLHDKLVEHFGGEAIVRDIDTIPAGADFVRFIEQTVDSSDVLVALIGRDWLRVKDSKGRRRLEDPQDYVRLELARALRRGIPVVPVLVEGAVMPPVAKLPEDLAGFATRNALEISDSRWAYDVDRLIQALETHVGKPAALAGRRTQASPRAPSPPSPSPPPASAPPPTPKYWDASSSPGHAVPARGETSAPGAWGAPAPARPGGGTGGHRYGVPPAAPAGHDRSTKTVFVVVSVVLVVALLAGIGALAAGGGGSGGGEDGGPDRSALPAPPGPGENFHMENVARFSILQSDLPPGYVYQADESGSERCPIASGDAEDSAALDKLKGLGFEGCHVSKWRNDITNPDGSTSYSEVALAALVFPDAARAVEATKVMEQEAINSANCDTRQADPEIVRGSGPGENPRQQLTLECGSGVLEIYAYTWRNRNVAVFFVGTSIGLGEQRSMALASTVNHRATAA